ncbi:MAG: hypothetical protein ABIX01_02810 [Chitinophagaceae bacterium]
MLAFIFVSREPQPNESAGDEDKHQSPIELRLIGLLLIANKSGEFIRHGLLFLNSENRKHLRRQLGVAVWRNSDKGGKYLKDY